MSDAQKREFRHRMRQPLITFCVVMSFLAVNALTGWLQPFPHVWILNLCVLFVMIAITLVFSMEAIHDPPLIRFFSALGFCWVGILFTMTMIDYLTR